MEKTKERINKQKNKTTKTTQGINFDAYEKIEVEVSGEDPPQPLEHFSDAQFEKFLQDNIQRSKYTKPTPIQKYAIPCVLDARDLMACAQTGSGKTAAFLLPIINQLASFVTCVLVFFLCVFSFFRFLFLLYA